MPTTPRTRKTWLDAARTACAECEASDLLLRRTPSRSKYGSRSGSTSGAQEGMGAVPERRQGIRASRIGCYGRPAYIEFHSAWDESVMHLSTSSWSITNSFFNTLIAYSPFVFFSSANMTFPKLPFPSTARKLKSFRPTMRFLGTTCCCD